MRLISQMAAAAATIPFIRPRRPLTSFLNLDLSTICLRSRSPIVHILEPCTHDVQLHGLCALCGKDLTVYDTGHLRSLLLPADLTRSPSFQRGLHWFLRHFASCYQYGARCWRANSVHGGEQPARYPGRTVFHASRSVTGSAPVRISHDSEAAGITETQLDRRPRSDHRSRDSGSHRRRMASRSAESQLQGLGGSQEI